MSAPILAKDVYALLREAIPELPDPAHVLHCQIDLEPQGVATVSVTTKINVPTGLALIVSDEAAS